MAAFALFASTLPSFSVPGAGVDSTSLPPPAQAQIEFRRDVWPILEKSCLRCHGPEKPKSRFRLDNRESALKGGQENTDDIIPGDSARSHLVLYVARQVEDMEMPPPGKGEPLTPAQVGTLRAWIDQGAKWDAASSAPQGSVTVTAATRWVGVQGDQAKFRELEGFKPGWGGGAEYFSLEQQDGPDRKIAIEGRVLWPDDDYRLKLTWTKTDFGFVRAGFERWRRYYDDRGGYFQPFTPPAFDLDRDLHLDIGRAWLDFGLTLPDQPQLVLGYEYQFKDGAKSMLEWGTVFQGTDIKNIYPAARNINEQVQILKLDLTHDLYGWQLENRARVEFYDDTTHDQQVSFTAGPTPNSIVKTRTDYSNVRGSDTLRIEKQITDWWFGSGGYLYSRLDGNSSLNQSTVDAASAPVFGNYWNNQVTLKRETHAFNLASLFVPRDGWSLSVGVQSEFSQQEGFGDISLDFGDPSTGPLTQRPGKVQSDLNETRISENALLRCTKIPFTVLFAEGRFSQDSISQFEQETGSTPDVFLRDTAFGNNLHDLRAGFSTSPRRWISFNAHYRRRESDSDYSNRRDQSPQAGLGYSAFIRHREITTGEVEGKLVLQPVTWLKTTLSYQWTDSDFFATTDPVTDPFYGNVSPGGQTFSGNSHANIYGLSATFMPSHRLYFSGAFTCSDNRTVTGQNDVPYVVPYQGNIYSVITSANYSLNPRTGLQTSWSFSQADYSQNNPGGLPLGLDYTRHALSAGVTRKLSKNATGSLGYSFYRYTEQNTGGLNNFTGHGVFATLALKWP